MAQVEGDFNRFFGGVLKRTKFVWSDFVRFRVLARFATLCIRCDHAFQKIIVQENCRFSELSGISPFSNKLNQVFVESDVASTQEIQI